MADMQFSRVFLDAIGYELAPVVVTSAELEERLRPLYEALRLVPGQLESLTGISERRWWEPGYPISRGAVQAARNALAQSSVRPQDIGMVLYTGVCREQFEPATACRVASELGVRPDAMIYDLSNACLGVLNGIVNVANSIELGQVKAGLVVSCETAREITETMIEDMLRERSMEKFKNSLATLTGGSGAVAVLVTDGSFSREQRRRVAGGTSRSAPEHHNLCRWGLDTVYTLGEGMAQAARQLLSSATHRSLTPTPVGPAGSVSGILATPASLLRYGANQVGGVLHAARQLISKESNPLVRYGAGLGEGVVTTARQFMITDPVGVLRHGVELGTSTWKAFLSRMGWASESVDKVICHQVGASHRNTILAALGIPPDKDYSTYSFLGNIGTVSLPLTAALAEERDFLHSGDRVSFLGIGSGLNCLMLGIEW
jgi:3-oxoacyl-[acyl-carrier-protein] synthase III